MPPRTVFTRDAACIDKYRQRATRSLATRTLRMKLSVTLEQGADPISRLPEDFDRFMVEPAALSVVGGVGFGFVGGIGIVGGMGFDGVAGVVGLVGMEPLAFFEHVRLQYGWTLVPSLYFGFCLQCYENQIR